ncbi:MAG: hypothetical protein KAI94_12460 [Anaerolineales bacterium]|nr:hypothetical protein [Anaerolineales bacterium]
MQRMEKVPAVFAIAVGVTMIGWWSLLLVTNQIPELKIAPIAASLHLAAEYIAGFSLLISGIGLYANRWWAKQAFYIANGMLLYAVVQASGYFAQIGQAGLVFMFGALFMLALFFLGSRIISDKAVY